MERNFKSIFERLDYAYEARLMKVEPITLHLVGPPGVGKSALVREWAEKKAHEMSLEFVDADSVLPEYVESYLNNADKYFIFKDCRLTGLDPVDLMGQPRPINSKYISFLPLATARLLASCAGVLFLDEFMNENRPNMLANAYKVVRDYKIGDVPLNARAIVVAASNAASHSNLVTSLPKPLRDRFDFVEVPPPDLEEWAAWMDQKYPNAWDREVLAYLYWKPSDFLSNVDDALDNGYEPPATPRGWTYVALMFAMIKRRGSRELLESVAKGKLGRVGDTLMAFLSNKVPSFEDLIKTPNIIKSLNVQQKYLASLTVASAINKSSENIQKSKSFLEYVAKEDDREFLATLFAMLEKAKRKEMFFAIKDNETIVKCINLAGSALL